MIRKFLKTKLLLSNVNILILRISSFPTAKKVPNNSATLMQITPVPVLPEVLGFAFLSFLNADLVPGIDLILRTVHLEQAIADSDIVVTGEVLLTIRLQWKSTGRSRTPRKKIRS